MATINQIQRGFVTFIDRDVSTAFEGWQRAAVVGGATLLAANFPRLAEMYGSNPMVAAFGIYNRDAGTIDIDNLYKVFVPQLGNEKIPITLPKIGTIKMGREEIDLLVKYIREA
jgi:hypothetical protein